MGFSVVKGALTGPEPITVALAKLHLGIGHDDDDEWIDNAARAARKTVETHTSRVFADCTAVLTIDDFPRLGCEYTDGKAAIRIPLWPVESVEEVGYIDAAGDAQVVDDADYLTFLSRMPALIYPAPGTVWPSIQTGRLGAVTVEFTAAADSEHLEMSKAAMLLLIEYWYVNRGSGQDGTGSSPETMGYPQGAIRIMNSLMRPMYT